jgi:hypothetical protein
VNSTPENFIRFSGLALMIGGLLATGGWILFSIFDPRHVNVTAPTWRIFNLLVIFGGVFMAMGLPGFYLSTGRSGPLFYAGLVIMFIGFVFPYIAVQSIETATHPDRPPIFFEVFVAIGAPSIAIGILLTALVIYTSGVYPRWIAIALVVAVLLGVLANFVRLPAVLVRGSLFSAFYTLLMAILGYLAMMYRGD